MVFVFATTKWSRVLAAGSADAQEAREAIAWLCERYWEPLRAYVRGRGFDLHAAEDLTQDFMLALLEGPLLRSADPRRGRFRTFLLACLDRHLQRHRERFGTWKRGGRQDQVGISSVAIPASDLDPAAGFDRDWAQALVNGALEQLGREFAEAGKVERWRVLKRFLWENGDATSYDESGCSLGLSRHGVRVAVHRMRRRFAELVRREVAETLADPTWEAVEEEIGDLLKALGRSAWASGKNSV